MSGFAVMAFGFGDLNVNKLDFNNFGFNDFGFSDLDLSFVDFIDLDFIGLDLNTLLFGGVDFSIRNFGIDKAQIKHCCNRSL